MSGISQYFHSEEGEVVALAWAPRDDGLFYEMHLAGDPHRTTAYDYGSDIGIDPELRLGHRAIYLRANPCSGIWVAPENRLHPDLDEAFGRVLANRRHLEAYERMVERGAPDLDGWLERLAEETDVPVDPAAGAPTERPLAPATIFLSYKSENVLMARLIHDRLVTEANSEVWFDLEQSADQPFHEERITSWLRESVHDCQVLTLLLTRAALGSPWVRREIEFGLEKAERDSDFHFVVLKLEDMQVPDLIRGSRRVVDCSGMGMGEVLENLYAAVYRRESRREWLAEQERRGWPHDEEASGGYDHLATTAGEARELRWTRRNGEVGWELEYTASSELKTARGSGPDEIVDPGIRPGDRVGFFHFALKTPLWMRSQDPTLSANDVIDAYRRVLENPPIDRPGKPQPARVLAGHTASFFAVAAPGLLLGKLTFAPEVSWWWVLASWVACAVAAELFENTVFRHVEGPGSSWWGSRTGLLTSLLMLSAGVVAAVAVLVRSSGIWGIPWMALIGGYLAVLAMIYFTGYSAQLLTHRRRRPHLDEKEA